MLYIKQKELVDKETKLQEEMKETIICTLRANNGRITFVSPDIEDEDLSLDDKYPVISTLWGKHGTHNIAITDVYLVETESGHPEIYVDGVEQELENMQRGFMVYPPQFSDIIYFLMTPVSNQIYDYATRLAIKEMVDKYNVLPLALYDENGTILNRYNDEKYSLTQKYILDIEKLMKDAYETRLSKDRDEIHSRIMEMADDLSTLCLIESQKKHEDEMMFVENGCSYFIEKYQDEFNDIYDETEAALNEFFNFEMN